VIPSIIRQALDPECPKILVGDMSPSRDLSYVTDTVAAFLALGVAPNVEFGRPYNAGTGRGVTIAELVDLVLDCARCRKSVLQDRERLRPSASEVRALLADTSRLNALTEWRPRIDRLEGLTRSDSWWRDSLNRGLVRKERGLLM